jgi:prophage regulatory protein
LGNLTQRYRKGNIILVPIESQNPPHCGGLKFIEVVIMKEKSPSDTKQTSASKAKLRSAKAKTPPTTKPRTKQRTAIITGGEALLPLPTVIAMTGLSRTVIYDRMARGEFPRPIQIGGHRVAWLKSEVEKWIEDTIKATRGEG